MCDALSSVEEEAYSLHYQHRYGKINGYDEFERKVQETEGGARLIWQGYHLGSLFYSPKKEDKEKAKHLGTSFTAELLASEELDSNSHLQYLMGWCYNNSIGVEENVDEAFRFFSMASEGGLAVALNNLGICYEDGIGVSEDRAKSEKLYRRAAIAGHAPAQCNLGLQYFYGDGVMQNYDEAVKWIRAAAEQGFAPAQCLLGECYDRGFGVEEDIQEAISWYQLAADQSDSHALLMLAECHRYGDGVSLDLAEAARLALLAGEQGLAEAQHLVATFYTDGIGVDKDVEEAFKWLQASAAQGDSYAFFDMGLCFENGRGVRQDVLEAVKWYKKAADNNYPSATEKLDEMKECVREAIWQNRKSFLLFLAQYQFIYQPLSHDESLPTGGRRMIPDDTIKPDPDVIHTVFHIDEMRREIMSFL